jgi:soluble lytic murein transglycosylase-like protein
MAAAPHLPYSAEAPPFPESRVGFKFVTSLQSLVFAVLLAGAVSNAAANIYMFTDENGAVHLSNVPADARYVLMIGDETPAVAAVPPQPAPAAANLKSGAPRLPGVIPFVDAIAQVASSVGLERALLHAVVATESNYNARAVSRKGAAGLMQLMPQTAVRYAVKDSFDPLQNLQGGALYLRDLIAMFRGDIRLALAAYNAGPGAVQSHGNRIPPYPETENYVPKVLAHYDRYRSALF